MAKKMELVVKQGVFEYEGSSPYIQEFSPNHVKMAGWTCRVSPEGIIYCCSSELYSDGEHKITFTIFPNGKIRLRLCLPSSDWRTLKKFTIPQDPGEQLNGVITLTRGGFIEERYAYFHAAAFQEFLSKHGLSKVQHANPNKLYGSKRIVTDGKKMYYGTETYVSQATWVIVRTQRFNVLITQEWDLRRLVGLPVQ